MILFGAKDLPNGLTSLKLDPFFEATNNLSFLALSVFMTSEFPEVREQQAQLAKKAGIEGFCYWHYWFGNGERVLERIFDDFVETGSPNLLFCMGWVNENWIGKWHGLEIMTIFEKKNPGIDDHTDHFGYLLPASRESRCMKVTSN